MSLNKNEIPLGDEQANCTNFCVCLEDAINNIEEVIADFEDMSESELIECRKTILNRLDNISMYLHELEW